MDSLGDRMKGYEEVTRHALVRRMPVIIRVDGRAFHTLTRGMRRPFDHDFVDWMQRTAVALCDEIQGARLGYVQSDEISVLLVDYQALETQSWFGGVLQKMCSIAASVATMAFNRCSPARLDATFDARVFNVPREDVTNYFLWRQRDATRNSIQGVGQSHFSQAQLHGLDCDQIQEKLFQEKGVNWNDTPTWLKRGSCAVRESYSVGDAIRYQWVIDGQIPVFSRDRDYVERHLYVDEKPAEAA